MTTPRERLAEWISKLCYEDSDWDQLDTRLDAFAEEIRAEADDTSTKSARLEVLLADAREQLARVSGLADSAETQLRGHQGPAGPSGVSGPPGAPGKPCDLTEARVRELIAEALAQ